MRTCIYLFHHRLWSCLLISVIAILTCSIYIYELADVSILEFPKNMNTCVLRGVVGWKSEKGKGTRGEVEKWRGGDKQTDE